MEIFTSQLVDLSRVRNMDNQKAFVASRNDYIDNAEINIGM
jgi:hypothetical protein